MARMGQCEGGESAILTSRKAICAFIERRFDLDASYVTAVDEYRVNLRTTEGGSEATAYYTNDAMDAIDTARYMRQWADSAKLHTLDTIQGS